MLLACIKLLDLQIFDGGISNYIAGAIYKKKLNNNKMHLRFGNQQLWLIIYDTLCPIQ